MKQHITAVDKRIANQIQNIDERIDQLQWKVIEAFQQHQVSDFHFSGSTGYGYNDRGREILDALFSDIFDAEAALVRSQFVSGTHAISTALFGVLRPGDKMLYISGKPYDTLHKVIGEEQDGKGSLRDFGIAYEHIDLQSDGNIDWDMLQHKWTDNVKVIGLQRSRGYAWRNSFTVEQIKDIVSRIKEQYPNVIVFVDNCYGEFTEDKEPTAVGVDLMAGSLIKNPGGGLAETGGYICGKKTYVEQASYRLTAPGIGGEVGATLHSLRPMYQGLFLAPHFVGQALKGSVFAAAMFEQLGFETQPKWNEARSDIIQAIRFQSAEQCIAFVQSVQKASAVDAHVTPEPWDMPGYEHPVIMAAGTFIQGGSLELSADAPIREPYIAYMQGGLTYSHVRLAVIKAMEQLGEI
ncbi:methionine gamma-lyase family protein [Longirhabdus pacifica]|uniref:methionine gamma-lyase family protein n=1 Tax=Longirhabdus pacifica TaxID=2305227 RepID=UPI001008A303|nr:methionine gamma-lyase family protein [Longirhabdus pacifica]